MGKTKKYTSIKSNISLLLRNFVKLKNARYINRTQRYCWYYNQIQWEQNNTLDCKNILTITLVFIKLFSKAKNRRIHFQI